MIPFALLFITAVLTGWQLFYRIMLAVWGVPSHWLHSVSLVGSFVLLVAAYTAAWSRRTGFRVALVGLVAIGISFVPGLTSLVSPPAHLVIRWYVYMPSLFLVVTTVYVLVGLRKSGATALYPASASRTAKLGILVLSVGIAIASAWYIGGLGRREVNEQQMTWQVVTRGEDGVRAIMLTSVSRPRHTITVASHQLASYLEQTKPSRVTVVVEKIYDHSKYKGWSLKSIAGVVRPGFELVESSEDPD